jgi:hypothetical protein
VGGEHDFTPVARLRGTRWHWNDWNDVIFEADGCFSTVTPDCEAGRCHWGATAEKIVVHWGDAGAHEIRRGPPADVKRP